MKVEKTVCGVCDKDDCLVVLMPQTEKGKTNPRATLACARCDCMAQWPNHKETLKKLQK